MLEKNQNDLIKIRLREKQLNVIDRIIIGNYWEVGNGKIKDQAWFLRKDKEIILINIETKRAKVFIKIIDCKI